MRGAKLERPNNFARWKVQKRTRYWAKRRLPIGTAVANDNFPRARVLLDASQPDAKAGTYQSQLSPGFVNRLAVARHQDVLWVDGGGGRALATDEAVRLYPKLRAVSITLSSDPVASTPRHRVIRRPLHQVRQSKIWKQIANRADLVTDVWGAFTYSDPVEAILLYAAIARPATQVRAGGVIEIVIPPGTYFDQGGRDVGLQGWFANAKGIELVDIVRSADNGKVAILRRTNGTVEIDDLRSTGFADGGNLVSREFEITTERIALD